MKRRLLIPIRPQGINAPQGQSENHVFNPPRARPVIFENNDISNGRTLAITAGANAVRVLPANKLRTMLTIQNNDAANDLRFRFGAAATASEGTRVTAGGVAFFDVRVPNQDVYIFSTSGITEVWVEEVQFQPTHF